MIGRDARASEAPRREEAPARAVAQVQTRTARCARSARFEGRAQAWHPVGVAALALSCAAPAFAAQSDAIRTETARIAELEAQVSELRAQLQRALTMPTATRGAAPTVPPASEGGFRAPPSALPRTPAVLMLEAGCPPGSVCLQLRCSERGWP